MSVELGERERTFFHTFGYLVLPGFFTSDEVAVMSEEYERSLEATQPLYAAPIGVRGQVNWSNIRDHTPFLADALEHERLCGAAEALLGDDAVGVMSNGNCFSGQFTEWHCDTSVSPFRSAKFVAYLEPLDGQSGALRVLPGSHHSPWHNDLYAVIGAKALPTQTGNPEDASAAGRAPFAVPEVPAQACVTRPGDVIVFDLRVWHASWGGSPRRRMCSFTYFGAGRTEEERDGLRRVGAQLRKESLYRELRRQREWMRATSSSLADENRTPAPQYSPAWLANTAGSERRARWIDELQDWGMVAQPELNPVHG